MEERLDMPLPTLNRTLFLPLLAFALLALSGITATAESIPRPPQVPVRGYVLMDQQSGNILADLKGDERMEPASITKLMTAYIIHLAC